MMRVASSCFRRFYGSTVGDEGLYVCPPVIRSTEGSSTCLVFDNATAKKSFWFLSLLPIFGCYYCKDVGKEIFYWL